MTDVASLREAVDLVPSMGEGSARDRAEEGVVARVGEVLRGNACARGVCTAAHKRRNAINSGRLPELPELINSGSPN